MTGTQTKIPPEMALMFRDRLRTIAARRIRDPIAASAVADATLRRVVDAMLGRRIESVEAVPEFVYRVAEEACELRRASAEERPGAGSEDPLFAVVDAGARKRVRKAIDAMRQRDREILAAYYGRGAAASVIALNLGLGPGAVRTRLARLRHKLAGVEPRAHLDPGEAGARAGRRCADADVARDYAAARLRQDRAAAFEAHYLACDACWAKLRSTLDIRAALNVELAAAPVDGPDVRDSRQTAPRSGSQRGWVWTALLLAAVAVAVVALRPRAESTPLRPEQVGATVGQDSSLPLRVSTSAAAIVPGWSAVPAAELYVVEVQDGGGQTVFERETTKTHLELPRGELPQSGLFYVRVRALDESRRVVVRSDAHGITLLPSGEP